MRNSTEHLIDRAVIQSLRDCRGRLVPADMLIASVQIKTDFLSPTRAEIEQAIRYLESKDRLLGSSTETGVKYKITESGEAWALEIKL